MYKYPFNAGRYWRHSTHLAHRVDVMYLWGLQAVGVGTIGRKKLLVGGYGCMAVTQMLLTITLTLQVVRLQPNDRTASLQHTCPSLPVMKGTSQDDVRIRMKPDLYSCVQCCT